MRSATPLLSFAAVVAAIVAIAIHGRSRVEPKWVTRLDVSAMAATAADDLARTLEADDDVLSVEVARDHREAAVWHRTNAPGDVTARLVGRPGVRVIETVLAKSFEEETRRRASPKKRKSCCGERR